MDSGDGNSLDFNSQWELPKLTPENDIITAYPMDRCPISITSLYSNDSGFSNSSVLSNDSILSNDSGFFEDPGVIEYQPQDAYSLSLPLYLNQPDQCTFQIFQNLIDPFSDTNYSQETQHIGIGHDNPPKYDMFQDRPDRDAYTRCLPLNQSRGSVSPQSLDERYLARHQRSVHDPGLDALPGVSPKSAVEQVPIGGGAAEPDREDPKRTHDSVSSFHSPTLSPRRSLSSIAHTGEGTCEEQRCQNPNHGHTSERDPDTRSWFYYDDDPSDMEDASDYDEREEDEAAEEDSTYDDNDDNDDDDDSGSGSASEGDGRSAMRICILPYFFNTGTGGNSPTETESSGSSASGSCSQDTLASSVSDQSGGSKTTNNEQQNTQNSGTGSSDQRNGPHVSKSNIRSPKAGDRKPLPFICWYPAAGIPCTAKHAKRSPDTRYLFNDHVWGKIGGLNHRLPLECQLCHLLFESEDARNAHIRMIRFSPDFCVDHTSEDLEILNRHTNSMGITERRKAEIDTIRKEIKNGRAPRIYDNETMALLRHRVESNISIYINGSDIPEKAARTELWKWYIIFKQLRPDDQVPLNPFTSKCPVLGAAHERQTNIVRVFNSNIGQLCSDGQLPHLSNTQRNALDQVFLTTMEMLGAEEYHERKRSVPTAHKRTRKRSVSPAHNNDPKRQKTSHPDADLPRLSSPMCVYEATQLQAEAGLDQRSIDQEVPVSNIHPCSQLPYDDQSQEQQRQEPDNFAEPPCLPVPEPTAPCTPQNRAWDPVNDWDSLNECDFGPWLVDGGLEGPNLFGGEGGAG